MKIEKIPEGIVVGGNEALAKKINELIDEIDFWKKSHAQLYDCFIRHDINHLTKEKKLMDRINEQIQKIRYAKKL